MERRILSGTGLEVSRIGLGTMTFGGQADEAAAARMTAACLDAGVNFFDTANVYTAGESERITGRVLGARRKDVVLASKVGMQAGDHPAGLSRDLILKAAEDSLARLNTDYLDIYYFHLPDYGTPIEESLEAMDRLVRQGKVRYVAASNYASWQTARMLCLAENNGVPAARIAQQMYNLIARRLEDEYIPMARELGVSIVAYNPLAGGLLTGKQQPAAPAAGTRFDGNRTYLDRYWNGHNFEAVERLRQAAGSAGRSLVSLAINWLLHHSAADSVILGASRAEQLEENLAAAREGPLPAAALAACDEVWSTLRGAAPKYNR